MKRLVVLFVVSMLLSTLTFGQDSNFDKRLLSKFSVEELKEIEENNPSEIKFLTFCIENAQYITVFPEGKEGAVEIKGEIGIEDIENINFFDLGIELIQDNYQYYKIKGSNSLLVIKSKDHILKALK